MRSADGAGQGGPPCADGGGSTPRATASFSPSPHLSLTGVSTTLPMFVAMERRESDRLNFRAMGCEVEIIVVGPEQLVDDGRRHIERLELLWSRFLADSEVSRLNAHAGVPVEVSPETRLLVRCGVEAWRATGGAFDPTMLDAIVGAGY